MSVPIGLLLVLCGILWLPASASAGLQEEGAPGESARYRPYTRPADDRFLAQPQWITGSRLLKLGETIDFFLFLPEGVEADTLQVFPRYLERADPGDAFRVGGGLEWVDALPAETLPLEVRDGRARVRYRPQEPGSYLARWRAGRETFYRYFAVIEDDWVVAGFSLFLDLDPSPNFHCVGIPLDYRLKPEEFDPDGTLFNSLLNHHRHYGDLITTHLPDTPGIRVEERVERYGAELERVRRLLPDPNDTRSARVEAFHTYDNGYTETLTRLGVNDQCGQQVSTCKPWLGMPEFHFITSPFDCRKPHPGRGGSVVSHQWDFSGCWHWLGPVSWHWGRSGGDFKRARECLTQCIEEFANAARLSGHPIFPLPLYDAWHPPEFTETYLRFMAFEVPKRHHFAYARSLDIADYILRHFDTTPRTIMSSRTDHPEYDMPWQMYYTRYRHLVARPQLPWSENTSYLMKYRRDNPDHYKDSLSYEYIEIEDRQRQMRFERECPLPIWFFDYTRQEERQGPEGGYVTHVETPEVIVHRSDQPDHTASYLRREWPRTDRGITLTLRMETGADFPDYAIALWGLPEGFRRDPDPARIETNARDFVLVRNRLGEYHLLLYFDLRPEAEIEVTILER